VNIADNFIFEYLNIANGEWPKVAAFELLYKLTLFLNVAHYGVAVCFIVDNIALVNLFAVDIT
jgi:hypothetical protein